MIPAAAITALTVGPAASAAAQSSQPAIELGAQVASVRSSQFDATDVGIGGRVAWLPGALVGVEAEVNMYPDHFPSDRSSFSTRRLEGLFGVTVGPRLARVRLFGRLRPGFVKFTGQPVVCILIYPPPLSCVLASGKTVLAVDVGGGAEVFITPKTFLRVDAGDRAVKYPGPSFDNRRVRARDNFFSHDFRFAAGGGVRF